MLQVTIYDEFGQATQTFKDEDEVDFVSLISATTYGPPPLVAPDPKGGRPPLAKIEDRVLYINTSLVPIFQIERTSD